MKKKAINRDLIKFQKPFDQYGICREEKNKNKQKKVDCLIVRGRAMQFTHQTRFPSSPNFTRTCCEKRHRSCINGPRTNIHAHASVIAAACTCKHLAPVFFRTIYTLIHVHLYNTTCLSRM